MAAVLKACVYVLFTCVCVCIIHMCVCMYTVICALQIMIMQNADSELAQCAVERGGVAAVLNAHVFMYHLHATYGAHVIHRLHVRVHV